MNKPLIVSSSLLLCSNLIALAFAIYFQWSLFEIVVLYWIQGLIIGISQKQKIKDMFNYWEQPDRPPPLNKENVLLMRRGESRYHPGLDIGFVVIYGLFLGMEGVVLLVKYVNSDNLTINPMVVLTASGAFLVSHWWSYRTNKPTDEKRLINLNEIFLRPFIRIILPLHIIFVTVNFDNAVTTSAVIVWMLVKTAADLGIHINEHGRS